LQEIHNGSTQTLQFTIFKDGVRCAADGAISVSIYDVSTVNASPTALVTGTASATDSEGLYTYLITPTLTSLNRVIRTDYSYSLNGISTTQSTYNEIVTPYTTISDLIDYYNLGTSPQDLNYKSAEVLQQLEKLARTLINGYVGQNFGRRYAFQEQFGLGSDALWLTERMISVNQMYENGVLVYDTTVSPSVNYFGFPIELTPTGKAVRIVNAGWDARYDNQVDPTIMYYGRFRESTRYKLYGTIGWDYVPIDIKLCATLLVGDLMANDAAWRIKYLSEVSMSDTSFKMAGGAFNGTGNLIVDNILDQYRNVGMTIL
jgi:hypothetical protein